MKKNQIFTNAIVFVLASSLLMIGATQAANQKSFKDKALEMVMDEGIKNQTFLFKLPRDKDSYYMDYEIRYLGSVRTKKGQTYKLVMLTTYSGLYEDSKRANNRIFFYEGNVKTGYYYLGGKPETPMKIVSNKLYFPPQGKDCPLSTSIAFDKGIPQEIFINCSDKGGDEFGFSTDDD